jgi:hypothetical protein
MRDVPPAPIVPLKLKMVVKVWAGEATVVAAQDRMTIKALRHMARIG